jgi:hypothetical protein
MDVQQTGLWRGSVQHIILDKAGQQCDQITYLAIMNFVTLQFST